MDRPEVHAELGGAPSEVSRARHLVGSHLAARGLDAEVSEVATLLVSELVTNALLHGSPPIRLLATTTAAALRVEIHDAAVHVMPAIRPRQAQQLGGRGLQLVSALATRWGAAARDDEKYVWFELALPNS